MAHNTREERPIFSEPGVIANREAVGCPICGAEVDQPCDFSPEGPMWVLEDGQERRAVHAARFALTVPEGAERQAFWGTAVDRYLASAELDLVKFGEQPERQQREPGWHLDELA